MKSVKIFPNVVIVIYMCALIGRTTTGWAQEQTPEFIFGNKDFGIQVETDRFSTGLTHHYLKAFLGGERHGFSFLSERQNGEIVSIKFYTSTQGEPDRKSIEFFPMDGVLTVNQNDGLRAYVSLTRGGETDNIFFNHSSMRDAGHGGTSLFYCFDQREHCLNDESERYIGIEFLQESFKGLARKTYTTRGRRQMVKFDPVVGLSDFSDTHVIGFFEEDAYSPAGTYYKTEMNDEGKPSEWRIQNDDSIGRGWAVYYLADEDEYYYQLTNERCGRSKIVNVSAYLR